MRYQCMEFEGVLTPQFDNEKWFQYRSTRRRNPHNIYVTKYVFEHQNYLYGYILVENKIGTFYNVELLLVPHSSVLLNKKAVFLWGDYDEICEEITPFLWSFTRRYYIRIGEPITCHLSHLHIVEDMFTNIAFFEREKVLNHHSMVFCDLTQYEPIQKPVFELLNFLNTQAQKLASEGGL